MLSNIKIADRFRPFSHLAGASCIVPGGGVVITAYPTRLEITTPDRLIALELALKGPIKNFTLMQDLEENCVKVFGHSLEGYFSFRITHDHADITVQLERGKEVGLAFDGTKAILQKKGAIAFPVGVKAVVLGQPERMSLGQTKQLDWDLVGRRGKLAEMLPVLFFLGQKVHPPISTEKKWGLSELERFLSVGVDGILVPQAKDTKHLGVDWQFSGEPSALLRLGYESTRALFVQKNQQIEVLRVLPSQFPFGRMKRIMMDNMTLDFMWTKGKLRTLQFKVDRDQPVSFLFASDLRRYRIRTSFREKGSVLSVSETIDAKKGVSYLLDKFER